ncbi:MAG TPA: hypothetical protein DER02_01680, partial [Gammaproteobacteria bacterium]|nr:hypothetical protein [Gammaproteobacteria bacterium]
MFCEQNLASPDSLVEALIAQYESVAVLTNNRLLQNQIEVQFLRVSQFRMSQSPGGMAGVVIDVYRQPVFYA